MGALYLKLFFNYFLDFGFLKIKNPGLNLRNGVFVCRESWLSPNAGYGLIVTPKGRNRRNGVSENG
jgi:hypothetical protein